MHLSEGHPLVYLYYGNKDQLRTQDQQFRSRTSLFQDQLSKGNASLQLTGVQVQDEGRYSCYISTINTEKDSFINLKVHSMTNLRFWGIFSFKCSIFQKIYTNL